MMSNSLLPATEALEQYRKAPFPARQQTVHAFFESNPLFQELEDLSLSLSDSFPTIAWTQGTKDSDDETANFVPFFQVNKTKKPVIKKKTNRKTKHRMVRSKSQWSDLSRLCDSPSSALF